MHVVTIKPIQIIIASQNQFYKKSLKHYFSKNFPFYDVYLTENLLEALEFFNDKPPFKLLIRKPKKPLNLDDIENHRQLEKKDVNLRAIIIQKKHREQIKQLNRETIKYLKTEKEMFLFTRTYCVLMLFKYGYPVYFLFDLLSKKRNTKQKFIN